MCQSRREDVAVALDAIAHLVHVGDSGQLAGRWVPLAESGVAARALVSYEALEHIDPDFPVGLVRVVDIGLGEDQRSAAEGRKPFYERHLVLESAAHREAIHWMSYRVWVQVERRAWREEEDVLGATQLSQKVVIHVVVQRRRHAAAIRAPELA